MKTIEQTRRELFEASIEIELMKEGYAKESVPSVIARGLDGEYQTIRMAGAWLGFNAAMDAVVIELPVIPEFDIGSDESLEMNADEYGAAEFENALQCEIVRKCRTAIESTNLGLKIK